MSRNIFIAGLIAFAFFTGFLAFLGAFKTIEVTERDIGPYHLVYESNTGSYRKTGPSVDAMMKLAEIRKVNPVAGFGKYYDRPDQVEESKLRSDAGIIIDDKDLAAFKELPQGVHYAQYPVTRAMVADFPLRGFLSIFLGIYKVYPALMDYQEAKKYPATYSLEIYELRNRRTVYAFPILAQ